MIRRNRPALASSVRGIGLPDAAVRAIEEIQQAARSGMLNEEALAALLVRWGLASPAGGAGGKIDPNAPVVPILPDDWESGEEVPDLTPPPPPQNLVALGGYTSIFLSVDPIFDRRFGYLEWWRAAVDDLGQAEVIGTSIDVNYVDEVQSSQSFFYWSRVVSKWSVPNEPPIVSVFNAAEGTPAETAPDASYALELLTGQITSSQLHADLGARIDLIDADESVAGSVGARIKELRTQVEQTDTALAQQILSLSAGAGEQQFDTFAIWHFDTSVDGWSGNGAPIAAGGWIRSADHGTDPYLTSPGGVNAAAATYQQVKLRVRRVGSPTWEGWLWWRATPTPWDTANRVSFTEPTFDESGVAIGTIVAPWSGTIDSIRLDLSTASSITDHYAIDWVAIGRPAPGASVAALQQEATVRAQTDSAMAASLLTLQAGVSGNTIAIQEEATTRATETGILLAKYTVKIDANGYVSGYGLASAANNAAPTSEFAVRADRFSVASPAGPDITPAVPFAVQTTPTTIDGITFQPGVYMTAAVMKKAIVENFVAGLAVIDDASIKNVRASKILASKLAVGQYIESQNYQSGTSGWRISADGFIEVQNALMRGVVYAGSGAIGGIQIGSTYLRSSNYAYRTQGFCFYNDGTIDAQAGAIGGLLFTSSGIKSQNYSAGASGFEIRSNGSAEFNTVALRGDASVVSLIGGSAFAPVNIGSGVQAGWSLFAPLGSYLARGGKVIFEINGYIYFYLPNQTWVHVAPRLWIGNTYFDLGTHQAATYGGGYCRFNLAAGGMSPAALSGSQSCRYDLLDITHTTVTVAGGYYLWGVDVRISELKV